PRGKRQILRRDPSALLGETHQQHKRGHGQDDPDQLIVVQRFAEQHHADGGEEQHHGNGVDNADGGQLQVSHYEYPPKRRRSIDSEADIKPTCPQGLVARARQLEEIVAQHADGTEGDRDEDSEQRSTNTYFATITPHVLVLSLTQTPVTLTPILYSL